MYSVDTGNFYSNHEQYLHNMNCKYRRERNYVANKLPAIESELAAAGYSQEQIRDLKNFKRGEMSLIDGTLDLIMEYEKWNRLIIHKREKAKESKEKLLALLANRVAQNEKTDGKDHIRSIDPAKLKDTNVISVFESSLTRMIGIAPDEMTDALITVQIYYFDVFKDISFYGFLFNGQKYRYYTSSAGQIRKKKAVFIKESVWNRIEKTAMCGLTIDKINEKGGINVNKYLAYMALTNSATDVWTDFDIDRAIVVDDFETQVWGTFDYCDEKTYTVTRKTDYIPIPHTDGAGMISPELSRKNFMVRAPFIKGLLGVFDFKRFIREHNCSSKVKDIYGKEYDIFDDNIQVIFTKSQLKLYKYYDSWDQYKEYFKKYGCTAGICNLEEDHIKNAKINYQMLQTLTDISDDEIDALTRRSAEKILNICTSKETMLEVLGVTPYNSHLTPYQEALKIYPALLTDTYAKDTLREMKDSLLKKYRSGKLEIIGKYTFLLPDFYAFCEWLFLGIETPKGLLADQEVYCRLFKRYDKLDCLRSPHLFKEHAVRFNVAYDGYGERAGKIGEWFNTDGIYTSTYDFISKILQFDVDGDRSLVVAEPSFVSIAERNMNNVVPLYYNMSKAGAVELNNKTIYAGLNSAFTHGNIGIYSNNISKIWNSEIFINGSPEEKEFATTIVKLLCMENNFCIDSAKTLYMPERVGEFGDLISKYTNCKLPAFFEFAKDKGESQIANRNQSFVNKIFTYIPNKPIKVTGVKLGKIDKALLMNDPTIKCTDEIAELAEALTSQYRYMINLQDVESDNSRYIYCRLKEIFAGTGYSDEVLSDMLVDYMYGKKKRYKQILWFCFGEQIVEALKKHLRVPKTKVIQCIDCGDWFEVSTQNSKTCRCPNCQIAANRKLGTDRVRNYRSKVAE